MRESRPPLRELYDRGAHFVLCDPTKRPRWTAWQERRPSLGQVVHWYQAGGSVGLIPWSLGLTVYDVDYGDPAKLIRDYPPLLVVASNRPGGVHIYWRDTEPRNNEAWMYPHGGGAGDTAAGEVRGARGYVILWGRAQRQLAAALRNEPWPTIIRQPATS